MTAPIASLSSLRHADGSATYSHAGYTVIGAVNGPIEVQRRDELPEEAFIEVNVRPASGVGTVRERHIESLLHTLLRSVILIKQHPRTLIQLTLQVTSIPEPISRPTQSTSYLPLLPPLLQTTLLTLLSSSLPLRKTFTSVLLALTPTADLIPAPSPKEIAAAQSLHVFCFSAEGELLLVESEGEFEMEGWERACEVARGVCCGREEGGMEVDGVEGVGKEGNMTEFVRGVVMEGVDKNRWKR